MKHLVYVGISLLFASSVAAAPKLTGSGKGGGTTRAEACDAAVKSANFDLQASMEYNKAIEGITRNGKGLVRDCVCSEPDLKLPKYLQTWSCQVTWTLNYS